MEGDFHETFQTIAGQCRYAYVYAAASKCPAGASVSLRYKTASAAGEAESVTATVGGEVLGELQKLVRTYDFARNNSLSHNVSGLPPMLGGRMDVRYESGEYIHIDDNQSPIISPEAGEAVMDVLLRAIR